MIHLLGSPKRGEALVGPGHARSLTQEEANQAPLVADKTIDARKNDRLFDLVWVMCKDGKERT
jgi:hypothetical protein